MSAFEQGELGAILDRQGLVVGEKFLIQLRRDFPRRNPLINRDIQRVPAPAALVDQPDVQLILVGVDTEPPGADKGHLFSAPAAAADDPAAFVLFFMFCIAHRVLRENLPAGSPPDA